VHLSRGQIQSPVRQSAETFEWTTGWKRAGAVVDAKTVVMGRFRSFYLGRRKDLAFVEEAPEGPPQRVGPQDSRSLNHRVRDRDSLSPIWLASLDSEYLVDLLRKTKALLSRPAFHRPTTAGIEVQQVDTERKQTTIITETGGCALPNKDTFPLIDGITRTRTAFRRNLPSLLTTTSSRKERKTNVSLGLATMAAGPERTNLPPWEAQDT